jgi:hypothetical protein
MDDPYLSSNESLILSTHNIHIEGASLDLMLTSRRLILIDNSVTPFQLRTIPLETIITVFAGMDVKGDPIFTLSHMDPSGTGAPHPMDFIFTRKKGEERATECNEWAATLSNYAAGARNEALSTGTLPYDPVKVIQPRMSATYRIETFSPRRPVIEEYPARAEPVPLPEISKSPVDNGIPAGTDEPVLLETREMFDTFDSSVIPSYQPEGPETPDSEVPVSPLREIAIGADENQVITGSARIWADAVRTVTSPLPVIPPVPAFEAIPGREIINNEPPAAAYPISTTPEEPDTEKKENLITADTIIPECPADTVPVQQPAQKAAPLPAALSSSSPKTRKRSSPLILIAAIIIVILVVLGAAVIGSFYPQVSGETPLPVIVPIVTVQPTPAPLLTLIPADGVWVRIEYPGTFIGRVGNPELMHPTSGSGVQLYKILWSDRIVQVSAQKQENSGDTLLVEVYNNGTLIKRSSTRVPMGSIEILINPITGQPPGIEHGDIP